MKKKMIITILGIALMAALAGCSGKGNEKDKGTEEKEENTQKEDSTAEKEDGEMCIRDRGCAAATPCWQPAEIPEIRTLSAVC